MTRTLVLQRALTDEEGTVGVLLLNGEVLAYTLELPWRWNQPNISCIRAGEYRMVYSLSPSLRIRTYEILDVPGRAGIRVHAGNLAGDKAKGFDSHSRGCPLLGRQFGSLRNSKGRLQRAVLLSQVTVRRFEEALGREPCILEVLDVS